MESLLPLHGLVFAGWVFLMFRMLTHARAEGQRITGRQFSGPVTFIRVVRAWFRAPEHRIESRALLVLTLLLVALIALTAILMPNENRVVDCATESGACGQGAGLE